MRLNSMPIFYFRNEKTPSYAMHKMDNDTYACRNLLTGDPFIANINEMDIRRGYSVKLMEYVRNYISINNKFPTRKKINQDTGYSLSHICRAFKKADREIEEMERQLKLK